MEFVIGCLVSIDKKRLYGNVITRPRIDKLLKRQNKRLKQALKNTKKARKTEKRRKKL